MSNALAVATVTQALALLIEHNLHPEIDMAVSVETRKPPADPPTDPTITVFLYQVTHNPSMRNNDLVTRASDGTLLKRPAAAIDLHFVISAYGEETELVGQRLIGSVVRTLHEIPVLPKELIEEAVQRPYLEGSDLAESLQKVRFTPTQMDVDETSKLWGMLNNTPYSLSVVYQASLVLLDGHEKPKPAKPVQRPDVTVLPFGAPGAPQPPVSDGAERTAEPTTPEARAVEAKAPEAEAPKSSATKAPEAKAAEATTTAAKAPAAKAAETKAAEAKPPAAAKKPAGDAKSHAAPARSRTAQARKTTGAAARQSKRSSSGPDGSRTGSDGGSDSGPGYGSGSGSRDKASPDRTDDGKES